MDAARPIWVERMRDPFSRHGDLPQKYLQLASRHVRQAGHIKRFERRRYCKKLAQEIVDANLLFTHIPTLSTDSLYLLDFL